MFLSALMGITTTSVQGESRTEPFTGEELFKKGYDYKKGLIKEDDGSEMALEKRFRLALEHFQAAMNLDYVPAVRQLAKLYLQGRVSDITRDDSVTQGLALMQEAANRGDLGAICNMMIFKIWKLFQEKDSNYQELLDQAIQELEKIRDAFLPSLSWLLKAYDLKHVSESYPLEEKRRTLYKICLEAIERKHHHGIVFLNEMISQGEIDEEEMPNAIQILRQAQTKIPQSLRDQIDSSKEPSKERRAAIRCLAELYRRNLVADEKGSLLSQEISYREAEQLYLEGMEAGSYTSQSFLGFMYVHDSSILNAEETVEERLQTIAKGKDLLNKARAAGNIFAVHFLPATKRDDEDAYVRSCIQREALTNSDEAKYSLLFFSDDSTSRSLTTEAAELGHFKTNMLLGAGNRKKENLKYALEQVFTFEHIHRFADEWGNADQLVSNLLKMLKENPDLLEKFSPKIIRGLIQSRDCKKMEIFCDVLPVNQIQKQFQQHERECALQKIPNILGEEVQIVDDGDENIPIHVLFDRAFEQHQNKEQGVELNLLSEVNIFHVIAALASNRYREKILAMQEQLPQFANVIKKLLNPL